MSSKIKSYVRKLTMVTLATIMFAVNPALAQSSGESNFICSSSGLKGIMSTIMQMAVVAGGFIAIAGGALYTVAAAARPGDDGEYTSRRNKSILLGGSVLFIIYGADAILTQIEPSLSYDCILPFVESGSE